MYTVEVFAGNWGVLNERKDLIVSGLSSRKEALLWIIRHTA